MLSKLILQKIFMKIFYASAENHTERLLNSGVKNLLVSFYSLKSKDINKFFVKAKENNCNIIVDSGAHTFQKGKTNIDYDKFIDEYIEFLLKYSEYIDAFVELDIENIVGLKKVEQWREKITQQVGREPMVVWHRERGWDYWKEMCRKYKYIGFSGFVTTPSGGAEVPEKFIPNFLAEAKKYKTKVHGFGFTSPKLIKSNNFYSVDSTSWLSGELYGHIYVFKQNILQSYSKKSFYKIYGKNNDIFYKDITKYNLSQWIKFGKYLEEYWTKVEQDGN